MGLDFNLVGKKFTFSVDYNSKTTNGEIKFLSANEYIVYISWIVHIVYSDQQMFTGESVPLFIKEEQRSNEMVIRKSMDRIYKHRIGRKKVFSNIQWDTKEGAGFVERDTGNAKFEEERQIQ